MLTRKLIKQMAQNIGITVRFLLFGWIPLFFYFIRSKSYYLAFHSIIWVVVAIIMWIAVVSLAMPVFFKDVLKPIFGPIFSAIWAVIRRSL